MKKQIFRIWQWIWGFPQTLLGLILLIHYRKCPRGQYQQCITIHWPQGGSMGLGMFLFIGKGADKKVYIHEYGHSIQSMILGPLFLPIMGLPSFLWCNLPPCRRMRKEKGISYYAFYPESTANLLGAWATKNPNTPQ